MSKLKNKNKTNQNRKQKQNKKQTTDAILNLRSLQLIPCIVDLAGLFILNNKRRSRHHW